MNVRKLKEYNEWFDEQPVKIQSQIASRIQKIELDNHFGKVNRVGTKTWELKFNNGNRIYYTIKNEVILLLGGNKNGQQKDIDKANKVAEEIHG